VCAVDRVLHTHSWRYSSIFRLVRLLRQSVCATASRWLLASADCERARAHTRDLCIVQQLARTVFREPRTGGGEQNVDRVLKDYTTCIERSGAALLLAVVGGKLSEGINFADDVGKREAISTRGRARRSLRSHGRSTVRKPHRR
jgi:hypothetical protein